MNDIEERKLKFYEGILLFLRENHETVVKMVGLKRQINKLFSVIDKIRETGKTISSAALQRTIRINYSKDELIAILLPVISALFNYAKENNDLLLKEKIRASQSSLILLRNFELLNRTVLLYAYAEKYAKKLKKYGLRSNSLFLLDQKLSDFKHIISNGNNSIFINGTEAIYENLFSEADKIIEKIDIEIENNCDDEYFYDEYLLTKNMEPESEEDYLYELQETE